MKFIPELIAILNNKADISSSSIGRSSSLRRRHFSRCLPFCSVLSGAGLCSIIASARINFWWSCLLRILNSFSSPCSSKIWACSWATTSCAAGSRYTLPNDWDGFIRMGKRDFLASWKHTQTQWIYFLWSHNQLSHPNLIKLNSNHYSDFWFLYWHLSLPPRLQSLYLGKSLLWPASAKLFLLNTSWPWPTDPLQTFQMFSIWQSFCNTIFWETFSSSWPISSPPPIPQSRPICLSPLLVHQHHLLLQFSVSTELLIQ